MTTTIARIERALAAGPMITPILSRALIAAGAAETLAASDAPDVRFTTEEERAKSLACLLRTRPTGDLWVFAYGSLIWNPALKIRDQRAARVENWHRAFCLSMPVGRGTQDNPGLALGLDWGGSCKGVAYRIADEDLHSELPILWGREMLLCGYIPQWVEIAGEDGVVFGHAIAFVIDSRSRHYAGALPIDVQIARLATAVGSWGTAADYLFRTCKALLNHGISDTALEEIAVGVAEALTGQEVQALAA